MGRRRSDKSRDRGGQKKAAIKSSQKSIKKTANRRQSKHKFAADNQKKALSKKASDVLDAGAHDTDDEWLSDNACYENCQSDDDDDSDGEGINVREDFKVNFDEAFPHRLDENFYCEENALNVGGGTSFRTAFAKTSSSSLEEEGWRKTKKKTRSDVIQSTQNHQSFKKRRLKLNCKARKEAQITTERSIAASMKKAARNQTKLTKGARTSKKINGNTRKKLKAKLSMRKRK